MDGIREVESSIRCRVHSGKGGAGGCRVSGSNEHCSRCHSKENQDFHLITEVVERQHQRNKKDGSEREREKMQLRGGCSRES